MYNTNYKPMRETVLAREFIVTGTGAYPGEADSMTAASIDEAELIAQDVAQRGRVAGIYALVKIHEPVTSSTTVRTIADVADVVDDDDLPF